MLELSPPAKATAASIFTSSAGAVKTVPVTSPLSRCDLEQKAIRHYATVRLGDQFRANLCRQLDDVLMDELGSHDAVRKRLAC